MKKLLLAIVFICSAESHDTDAVVRIDTDALFNSELKRRLIHNKCVPIDAIVF